MTNTPITNESEAMEVWFRAKETFAALGAVLGKDGRHRDATDGDRHQAAARVIATALEARDARIAELEGLVRAAIRDVNDFEWQVDARAILTKENNHG